MELVAAQHVDGCCAWGTSVPRHFDAIAVLVFFDDTKDVIWIWPCSC